MFNFDVVIRLDRIIASGEIDCDPDQPHMSQSCSEDVMRDVWDNHFKRIKLWKTTQNRRMHFFKVEIGLQFVVQRYVKGRHQSGNYRAVRNRQRRNSAPSRRGRAGLGQSRSSYVLSCIVFRAQGTHGKCFLVERIKFSRVRTWIMIFQIQTGINGWRYAGPLDAESVAQLICKKAFVDSSHVADCSPNGDIMKQYIFILVYWFHFDFDAAFKF